MIIEPEANAEFLDAAQWYDEQRDGLGEEFLQAVDEQLARIAESPNSFPQDNYDSRARRGVVSRFP